MSVEEKVRLVEGHQEAHGLQRCLSAVALPASTWYYRQQRRDPAVRDEPLKAVIRQVIEDHPDYGYRRIVPEVGERTGEPVNAKRIRRILSTYQLGLRRALPKYRKGAIQEILDRFRGSLNLLPPDPECGRRLRILSTDFTELVHAGGQRKGYLMAYVDVVSKAAIGWAVGEYFASTFPPVSREGFQSFHGKASTRFAGSRPFLTAYAKQV